MSKEIARQETYDPTFDNMIQGMMMMMLFIVILPMLPVVQSAQRYYESQQYEGQTDPRTLNATNILQHIVLANPWIGAYFVNDGPDVAECRLNNSDNSPFVINPGETITINRAGARDRIYAIYYQCYAGGTATLRIIGEY